MVAAAKVLFSRDQVSALCDAIDMKVASLRRAQKGSKPSFQAIYEEEINSYAKLKMALQEGSKHGLEVSA